MKFIALYNDGMSVNPFEIKRFEAESKEIAYEYSDEMDASSNIGGCWIMTEEEFEKLKEVLK